ncbi:MAG: NotI family restriction endonuclease [Bryobacteraceae bacterium]
MVWLPLSQRGSLCPFQSTSSALVRCGKKSGVCSIRQYRRDGLTGSVEISPGASGVLRTVCPQRFAQAGIIFQWIGETILKNAAPLLVREISFLQRRANAVGALVEPDFEDVGRIDRVLVHPVSPPFRMVRSRNAGSLFLRG